MTESNDAGRVYNPGSGSGAAGPGFSTKFAEDYLRMKMLAAAGTKAGLDKSPDVLAQLNLMRENLVANAQLQKIEEGIKVSDDDLKKKYEESKGQYEQVKARHILIAFKGSPAAQQGTADRLPPGVKSFSQGLHLVRHPGRQIALLARVFAQVV